MATADAYLVVHRLFPCYQRTAKKSDKGAYWSFMNCDIERRKSFDVNGDDFAYSDILQPPNSCASW